MIKLYKKIDKVLEKNRRKALSLANNLMAGIITGGIIGQIFPNFYNANLKQIGINIILIALLLFLGYMTGRFFIRKASKDNKEDRSYNSNFLAGLIASFYASILPITSKSASWYLIGIPLAVLFIIWAIYLWAKTRKSKAIKTASS